MEVVHLVIEIIRRWMAGGTLRLAKEQFLPGEFASRGLRWVEHARDGQFRCRRKVEHILHLGHVRHLDSLQNVHAFLERVNRIAIEVSGALFKLGEILDRTQTPLRPVNLLIEQAAETDGVQSYAPLLGPDVWSDMKLTAGVAIRMTIQALSLIHI